MNDADSEPGAVRRLNWGCGSVGEPGWINALAGSGIQVNANDIQVGVLATDAQHGVRGGGTRHAAATNATNGFETAARVLEHESATENGTASTLVRRGSDGVIRQIMTALGAACPTAGQTIDHLMTCLY